LICDVRAARIEPRAGVGAIVTMRAEAAFKSSGRSRRNPAVHEAQCFKAGEDVPVAGPEVVPCWPLRPGVEVPSDEHKSAIATVIQYGADLRERTMDGRVGEFIE